MAKIQRHLSIHFKTRLFKGITHKEMLSEVENKIKLDNVGSVRLLSQCLIKMITVAYTPILKVKQKIQEIYPEFL